MGIRKWKEEEEEGDEKNRSQKGSGSGKKWDGKRSERTKKGQIRGRKEFIEEEKQGKKEI
jgi:hypothetical protein